MSDADLMVQLREALRAYVVAQGRMLDRWAEGDDAVKQELWQALHACEFAGDAALDAADCYGAVLQQGKEG